MAALGTAAGWYCLGRKSVSPSPHTAATATTPHGGSRSPARTATGSTWLGRLNYYRMLSRLEPVTSDAAMSRADAGHARYLVANQSDDIRAGKVGPSMHTEDPAKPWFTPAGRAAAALSDVDAVFTYPPEIPEPGWAIENWITAPFHRLWLLNPALKRVGYGQFCTQGLCAAALDVRSGIAARTFAASYPVAFPPNGATIRNGAFSADEAEWPDPLVPCRGYHTPAGIPITLALGPEAPAILDDYALWQNNRAVESCGFDADSYASTDRAAVRRVHKQLAHFNAIVIVPRAPLARGATYTVSVRVSGRPYRWRFAVAR